MIMPPILRRLAAARTGVSTVEFAFIAPVLLTIICGTIDLGYLYMAQTSLIGATARAARESAATQESTQDQRNTKMRATISALMRDYRAVSGGELAISSRVYTDFANAKPEPYQDTNANGRYDPPSDTYVGDPFTDRNGNGVWDQSTPVAGTTGDTGDVVSYTATFSILHLFGFLPSWDGKKEVRLSATSVVRNEPVKTE